MAPTTGREDASPSLPTAAHRLLSSCRRALETAAFWLAVSLPAVYGPLLAAGAHGAADPDPAFYLVGLHAVAVAVGHGHDVE